MSAIDPNTPVLVGIGIIDQKCEDWHAAKAPVDLMVDAAGAALRDSTSTQLAESIERVYVPRGLWHYGDPARQVADALGASRACSVLLEIGVLQQTAIGDACRRLASGEISSALVVGGEAKYRELRARIAGEEATEATEEQRAMSSDITLQPAEELYLAAELDSGLGYMPVNYYAIMESAFRAARGWSIEESRDRVASMYARFSEIATDNPHAWKPGIVEAQLIRDPGPKNPMLAFPYTKLHNTSWNVDQAGALLFCSAVKAQALGIPRERWLFPLASAESNHMRSVAQRRDLHRVPGIAAAAGKAFEHCGLGVEDIEFAEFYSCFPVAVESYAQEMDFPLVRDLTVTGGMPFAGGPLNNFVLQSTCRMAQLMRARPGSRGLVTSVSGLLTKQGLGLWSTRPPTNGFGFFDVTEEVAAGNPPLEVLESFQGPATVAGYTVLYQLGEPQRAVAMVDTAEGQRAVVWSEVPELMQAMEREEFCGRTVQCSGQQFALEE